jgi:isopenicillin N synthase-like dioxygenase
MNIKMDEKIPIVDISDAIKDEASHAEKKKAAAQIGAACRTNGFFYIIGHGIDVDLQNQLESISKRFFSLPLEEKLKIKMALGGLAWRGYFPIGGELTSGRPDMKEGIYFGSELDEMHPLVLSKMPLHGKNLFPDTSLLEMRTIVLSYMDEMKRLGHRVMELIAISLHLNVDYFHERYTKEPLELFRIFNYPPVDVDVEDNLTLWGVGEHTDYGLLTILKQDSCGGLQIKSQSNWLEAPYVDNSFVCNIGDMLDKMTAGLYRSTPHRVKAQTKFNRLSFPFFFDPNFKAQMSPIESELLENHSDDRDERWDKESVHEFSGTYGEYLLRKVGRVFPELKHQVLENN